MPVNYIDQGREEEKHGQHLQHVMDYKRGLTSGGTNGNHMTSEAYSSLC